MISNLLSKLKPPNILRDSAWIPRFRDTCFPPLAAPPPRQSKGDEDIKEEEAAAPSEDDPSPTSWQHHLAPAPPEAYTSAFSSLLSARSTTPSLIWFGEQHHQPHVIRAQIQLLAALADHLDEQAAAKSNAPPPPTSSTQQHPPRRVRYHLHLLMEHFSLLDQPLLDRFHSGLLDIGELCAAYRQRSDEKFQVEMYAPLLLLARERGAQVWGGFPPRSWARRVVKEGVETVRRLEGERVGRVEAGSDDDAEPSKPQTPSTSSGGEAPPQPLIPLPILPTTSRRSLPLFTSWHHVTHLSRSHRSFLDSLMKPHLPPYFPRLPADSGSEPSSTFTRYPTQKLDETPPSAVSKGFAPAQALKDAYLAHAASSLLREGHLLAGHAPAEKSDEDVEHRNIVMVVAGLGHVQAGFGAPERVVMPGEERAGGAVAEGQKEDGGKDVKESLIVLSMPRDSSLWLGAEWKPPAPQERDSAVAPTAATPSPAKTGGDAANQEPAVAVAAPSQSASAVIPEGWDRKLADAIVLYDWIDLEKEKSPPPPPTQEETPMASSPGAAAATAPGHQASAAAAAAHEAEQKDCGERREGKGEKKSL